jgi:hypothetical protein
VTNTDESSLNKGKNLGSLGVKRLKKELFIPFYYYMISDCKLMHNGIMLQILFIKVININGYALLSGHSPKRRNNPGAMDG